MQKPETQTEATAETNPFENVVMFGRKGEGGGRPYTPPPEPAPSARDEIKAGAIDEESIRHLEAILEKFKAGELHGLVLIAGEMDRNSGNHVAYVSRITEYAYCYPYSFVGVLEDVKLTLLDGAMGAVEAEYADEFDDQDED